MKTQLIAGKILLFAFLPVALAASQPVIELTAEWQEKIGAMAPSKPAAAPLKPRKALLFSRSTGFKHWVAPHTAEVVKILGTKSGAFEVTETDEVGSFEPDRLAGFDLVILNNNCSVGPRRDLFFDLTQDEARAARLEASLLARIRQGAGLAALHGAIVMQNNSAAFSEMLGGSFDFHPRQQEVVCRLPEPGHPLVAAFGGKPFGHIDEPYLFKNAYHDKEFRSLLEMDTSTLDCGDRAAEVRSEVRSVSWIKRYGKGRVFYCSPSHNAQSFERPELLRFLLAGLQYAAGDLKCDDLPVRSENSPPGAQRP